MRRDRYNWHCLLLAVLSTSCTELPSPPTDGQLGFVAEMRYVSHNEWLAKKSGLVAFGYAAHPTLDFDRFDGQVIRWIRGPSVQALRAAIDEGRLSSGGYLRSSAAWQVGLVFADGTSGWVEATGVGRHSNGAVSFMDPDLGYVALGSSFRTIIDWEYTWDEIEKRAVRMVSQSSAENNDVPPDSGGPSAGSGTGR